MKRLSIGEANVLLRTLDLKIGDWSQITTASEIADKKNRLDYVMYEAPKDSKAMSAFSEYAASWLPAGSWKLVQIDNSTSFNTVEAALISRLLFCLEDLPSQNALDKASILFEFGTSASINALTELLISNLIHLFLLFRCHAEITSSGCDPEQFLSIQDGFVYFLPGKNINNKSTENLLQDFERNPDQSPQWIVDIIEAGQEA